jgi:hypothetical protein
MGSKIEIADSIEMHIRDRVRVIGEMLLRTLY